ncbi:PD-(D/E)XK nuclease family protein [Halorubrum sp. FL23]|uniref:PD-(D/E)XK nuclease family protein n=1 Tax=Halorubrum sp. FL23 TaxID=3458704 RepID=UPI004034EF46
MTIEQQLESLQSEVEQISEQEIPPKTSFEVFSLTREEGAWQAYLRYFLDPSQSHGLETDFLSKFIEHLRMLGYISDSGPPTDPYLLSTVTVEQEVSTENSNRPDIVVYDKGKWFLCLELKIDSTEGGGEHSQTERYASDTDIVPLSTDVYDQSEYLYVSPKQASKSKSKIFVDVNWTDLIPVFDSVISSRSNQIPTTTLAQLIEFRNTVKSELMMTKIDKETQHKKDLYFEYREAIESVNGAIEPFVKDVLRNEWRDGLQKELQENRTTNRDWKCDAVGHSYGQLRLPDWISAKDGKSRLNIHFEHKPRVEHFKTGRLEFLLELEEQDGGRITKDSGPQYHAFRNDLLAALPEVIESSDYDESQLNVEIDPSSSKKKLLSAMYKFQPGNEEEYYSSLATALIDFTPVSDLVSETLSENDYSTHLSS